jgi:hypothetical protein
MLLLFCDNLDSPDLPPAAGAFLKQKAPKNLIRERDQAEKEADRIVGDISTLLFVLSLIAGFIFMIGWSGLGVFIMDFSLLHPLEFLTDRKWKWVKQ